MSQEAETIRFFLYTKNAPIRTRDRSAFSNNNKENPSGDRAGNRPVLHQLILHGIPQGLPAGEQPTVVQVETPSVDSMSTRTMAAVALCPSITRTL